MKISSVATKAIAVYNPKSPSNSDTNKASIKAASSSKNTEGKRLTTATPSGDTVRLTQLLPPSGNGGAQSDGQGAQAIPTQESITSAKQLGLLLDHVA